MRETRVGSLGWEDLLEKEMATHSSTLAWKIPGTEGPGGLQSMFIHHQMFICLLRTEGSTQSHNVKVLSSNLSEHSLGFPGSSAGKESTKNAGDPDSIPGSGRSLAEGNGNPLQYSGLESSMDGGACWATAHGVAQSRTRLK